MAEEEGVKAVMPLSNLHPDTAEKPTTPPLSHQVTTTTTTTSMTKAVASNEETKKMPSSNKEISSLSSNSKEVPTKQDEDDQHEAPDDESLSNEEVIAPSSSVKNDINVLVEKTRRIMFTDAAVAIALTLLILPLMEASVDARGEDVTTLEWFQENKDLLNTFFLSYCVIALAWVDHDQLYATVRNFTRLLSFLNFLWLWTIAFLPAATNIMNGVELDASQHFIWIGTILGAKFLTFLMTIVVHRNPSTWEGKDGPSFTLLLRYLVAILLLVTALLLSATPGGYWMMLLLVLKMPIIWLILWKWPSLKTKWRTTSAENEPADVSSKSETCNNIESDKITAAAAAAASVCSSRESIVADGFNYLVEAERRIIFTDAAAAIALTLLVLPIMDAATEARGEKLSTIEWFQENRDLMLSFFLSYFVIIMCWNYQDKLVRRIEYFTKILSALNFLWLLAVVFIPVATSLVNSTKDTMLQHAVYIGTPLLAAFWTLCMTIEVHRNPDTWQDADGGPKFPLFIGGMVLIVLFIVAVVVSFTSAGYLALLLLILKTPLTRLILWRVPSLKTRW